ncbi:FMN-binding negative transcriptional regulator [Aneurinibacillus sp. Ricciae_BoGa-3]|uniref:FMN-binding negative transcriptional regulator n=1 Tax=Aneurinibacillus sp. Ricciae_BoGa-3 TaxID=3022697 RepID=UPI0023406284|nr:FMN-binding negative transcriptional regulator [Aneurinibacillus sp. Ricciae_BoGa-3]WCK55077.1 FMN-binding negative transcriptional regulator [Aneurinibacillus sp. Ricciae_BoGa-3]
MYIPSSFEVTEKEAIYDFMEKHSFAIVFSQKDNTPFATHLPLLLDRKEECLYGHMAKANPHWKEITNEILVVFNGAHTYISPSWYETNQAVPTWNYVAVHAYGKLELVEDNNQLAKILAESVNRYESSMPNPWNMDLVDPSFIDNLSKAVVGFKIQITKLEGKWKLSQNHSKERQERVINALELQGDENSKQIAQLMKMNLEQTGI